MYLKFLYIYIWILYSVQSSIFMLEVRTLFHVTDLTIPSATNLTFSSTTTSLFQPLTPLFHQWLTSLSHQPPTMLSPSTTCLVLLYQHTVQVHKHPLFCVCELWVVQVAVCRFNLLQWWRKKQVWTMWSQCQCWTQSDDRMALTYSDLIFLKSEMRMTASLKVKQGTNT